MVKSHWWADWSFHRIDEKLSILNVLDWGEMDTRLAGLLWLLMEQRASLIVAAGPSFVGKSTLFHALLDFLPPEITQVTLRGYEEDFKSLGTDNPQNTYLITEEISNHSYEYLWGYQVIKAFECIKKGYSLGGTTHAREIKEIAYLLNALGVPADLIGALGAVVTLQVARGRSYYDEPVRFVDTVSTFNVTKDGLVAHVLASRNQPHEQFAYAPEQTLQTVFRHKFAAEYDSINSEMDARGRILHELHVKGADRPEVKRAVREYYRTRQADK